MFQQNSSKCFLQLPTYFSFFSNAVLKISSGIDDGIFNMRWELFAYLLLAWVVVYFVVWKGLHNSGKVNKHSYPCDPDVEQLEQGKKNSLS